MKKIILNLVALASNAKIHATHTAIKGRKSGGTRDNNGKDWKEPSRPGGSPES